MSRTLTREFLNKLNKEYGDGFYILDSDVFKDNYKKLKEVFQNFYPNFNIAYSYKTNYIPKLCKIVDENGGFAEIVSEMEEEIAKRNGVEAAFIIWNGPIKNKEKMKKFLFAGGTINIDNLVEWEEVKDIAKLNSKKQISVGIRVNFDVEDGIISRFGFDVEEDDFDVVCKGVKEQPNIIFTSLQCHFAKREVDFWEKRTRGMLSIYDRLVGRYGLYPGQIDLGGAIYGHMTEDLAEQVGCKTQGYQAYAESSARIVAEHFANMKQEPLLLIEPGTAIVADCMKAVFKVKSIKTVRGKTIATIYGSQNNISMSGINPPIEVIYGGGEQKEYTNVDFAGYTCIESDYLYKGYKGKLAVGDYVVFSNCGSYSIVMKPPFILPNFPIVDIGGDMIKVVKHAEKFDELFSTYVF